MVKVMKVGILTFHRVVNYGALLQAYALQQYIESIGYDSSVVDYWPKYRQETLKVFSWINFINMSWKQKLRYVYITMFTFIRKYRRIKNTCNFVNRYIRTTKEKEYDIIVCGSDQIWRKIKYPLFCGYDANYFGAGDECIAKRKISYAASMGKVLFKEDSDKIIFKKLIYGLDDISVREIELKKYLEDELKIQSKLVCDPVFLIGMNGWKKIIDSSLIPDEPYILYYNHQQMRITTLFVNKLAKEKNLKVIEMRGEVSPFHYSSRFKLTANAQDFISLLYGADYVVTSSFHGVALSVCLQKQFYYASVKAKSNRIDTLVSFLGLADRDCSKLNSSLPDIVYSTVNKKIKNLINESKYWLNNSLNNYNCDK